MVLKASSTVGGVPASGVIVTDGQTTTLANSDDTGNLATVTANVVDGALVDVALPSNKAVLTDQQASVNINQYDNTGSVAATVAVAANAPTFQLANATTRIAVNGGPVQVSAGAKTVSATAAVSGGAWQPFPLANATDAILSNADAIEIENQGGTQDVMGTVDIAASVAKAKLPANSALVGNNVAIVVAVTGTYVDTITPQVNAAGVITGFTLS